MLQKVKDDQFTFELIVLLCGTLSFHVFIPQQELVYTLGLSLLL